METVDLIRLARPDVAEATAQEAASIKASFERKAVEEPGRIRAFLRRLSRRQLIAGILAILIVPAGTVRIATEIFGEDRSEQVEQAIEIQGPTAVERNQRATQGLIEGCRELQAQGLESAACTDLLQQVDQGEGAPSP